MAKSRRRPRPPRAAPVLRAARRRPAARRSDPLPRGSQCARNARAAGRRGARAHPRRDEAGGDPCRLPERGTAAAQLEDRTQRTRRAVCDRRPDPDRQDGVGQGPASLCCASSGSRGSATTCTASCAHRSPVSPGLCGLPRRTPSRPRRERPARVVEETLKLRGQPLRMLDTLRAAAEPLEAVRGLTRSMIRAAYGLEGAGRRGRGARPAGAPSRHGHSSRNWRSGSGSGARSPARSSSARWSERLQCPRRQFDEVAGGGSPPCSHGAQRSSSCSVSRRSFPRRQQGTPFLDEEERRSIDEASRERARLAKPNQVSRERYFFYTACTRPSRRLYFVREASTDDGSPREPSPFWDEAQALFDLTTLSAGRLAGVWRS